MSGVVVEGTHPTGPPSKFAVLARQTWTDAEPDTCSISLELDAETGEPHIVVSGCATWLKPHQARQAALFMLDCVAKARAIEGGL